MKPREILNKIKENDGFQMKNPPTMTTLTEVYNPDPGIHNLKMYTLFYNKIPSVSSLINIDCNKAAAWLLENCLLKIQDYYFRYYPNDDEYVHRHDYFLTKTDLMLVFEYSTNSVIFYYKTMDTEDIEQIIDGISKFEVEEEEQFRVLMLTSSYSDISIEPMNITEAKLNIADNYNDDFQNIHDLIFDRLNTDKDKGLVLLHGKPGTGKTYYLRHLISIVKKKVIFSSPTMANAIDNPKLLSILMENPNSILVIEDAENIIMDREQFGASGVSTLLNISDGLLSDILNIQIICTFNTDLSKVDSALLRKGRLIAKYEFKELEFQKAQKLSDKLGFKTEITKPMTLTDIYNQTELSFQEEKRKAIGFYKSKSLNE